MTFRLCAICFISLCLLSGVAQAQEAGVPPVGRSLRPILIDVQITGNSSITTGEIESRIQSRATSTSLLTTFAGRVRPISKRMYLYLRMRARETQELRYLNKAIVETDKEAIENLYGERGFHNVRVRTGYAVDTASNTARIRFDIVEGERAKVWWVHFHGLEEIPPDLRARVEEAPYLRPGSDFDVLNVEAEVGRALDLLRNSGYAFATQLKNPNIIICRPPDCDTLKDGIEIFLYPGTRYRFDGTTVFHDTVTHKQQVSEDLIRDQIQYKSGDWFSWKRVDETRRRLYRLGVFEQLSVDTLGPVKGDSLPMKITYRLRDQWEAELSLEIGIAPRGDEVVFTGGTAGRITRSNIGGRGIRASVGGRLQARLPTFEEAEYGVDGRLDVPKPLILPTDVASITGGYTHAVEDREGDAELLSNRLNLGMEWGWAFPSYTVINGITARLLYQKTNYYGVEEFIRAKADALINEVTLPKGCTTESLRNQLDNIVQTLARTIYRVQVLQGDSPNLAPSPEAVELRDKLAHTAILGASLTGDHRNNFFAPTDGYFIEGRVDLGLTGGGVKGIIGEFLRFEGDVRKFWPRGRGDVFAVRGHAGIIAQLDDFPVTPIGSRFHAGGANSVRGWGVREMLVTTPPAEFADSCSAPIFQAILDDSRRLLGGLMLIEGSAEYRLRINESLVAIGFIDIGNAYFQNYSEDKELLSVWTVLKNLGLATGVNFGFDTPAGPIRAGFGIPVFNPIDFRPGRQWIWQHPLVFFKDAAFQFTIGHAF